MVAVMSQEVSGDWDWRGSAACAGLDRGGQSIFFVEGYGATYPKARKYCSGCAVVVDCLMEALDTDAVGMWGCMSPNERTEIMNAMEEGLTLKQAADRIWNEQRRRGKRGMLVPKKSVWKDWDA